MQAKKDNNVKKNNKVYTNKKVKKQYQLTITDYTSLVWYFTPIPQIISASKEDFLITHFNDPNNATHSNNSADSNDFDHLNNTTDPLTNG